MIQNILICLVMVIWLQKSKWTQIKFIENINWIQIILCSTQILKTLSYSIDLRSLHLLIPKLNAYQRQCNTKSKNGVKQWNNDKAKLKINWKGTTKNGKYTIYRNEMKIERLHLIFFPRYHSFDIFDWM